MAEAVESMSRNGLTSAGAHLYCAANEDNFEKLSGDLKAFQQSPVDGRYAGVNFFTSKYFEGIDIVDADATIILVTDVNKAHTAVGITNKGVQAVGRLRNTARKIIHITNSRKILTMKTLAEIKAEHKIHAQLLIEGRNLYVNGCKSQGLIPKEDEGNYKSYSVIEKDTQLSVLNWMKFDQVVNGEMCGAQYNNNDSIVQAWESALYQVEEEPYFDASNVKKRASKADKLKAWVEQIEELQNNRGHYVMGAYNRELTRIQNDEPFAVEAYLALGKEKLEELNYNSVLIKEALILKHNHDASSELLNYLDATFVIGERYPITKIVDVLSFGYKLYRIRNPKDSKIRKASATHLEENGWFKTHPCKLKVNGAVVNGYEILTKQFNVAIAA